MTFFLFRSKDLQSPAIPRPKPVALPPSAADRMDEAGTISWLFKTLAGISDHVAEFTSAGLRESEFSPELRQGVTIDGQRLRTLKQAAYALRQYSLDHDDYNAWRLSHVLRDADTPLQARLAEAKLQSWIRNRKSCTKGTY